MTYGKAPRGVLRAEIAELERELATALAACPAKQRGEMNALRSRLEARKRDALARPRRSAGAAARPPFETRAAQQRSR
jgi:hypothetical protein